MLENMESLIENTTMQKLYNVNGTFTQMCITPCVGYVLHDKDLDKEALDENFEPTGEIILGFYTDTTSVRYDYDFTVNSREFYAVLESEVPDNAAIFNVPSGDYQSEIHTAEGKEEYN